MAARRSLYTVMRHHKWSQLSTLSRASSSFSNIALDVNTDKGVGVLTLKRPPVNSLDLTILEEVVCAVDTLEKDARCRGLIITSGIPGVFCAGLDIMEMYQPDVTRLRQYWTVVQEWWIRIYGSKLAVIAAINGHSPGAGCMMALCSDYRLMAHGPFTIGLNEGKLGIITSTWSYFMGAMANATGHRVAESGLQLGHLYSGDEALSHNLVDELLPPSDLLTAAYSHMDQWLQIPDVARQTTKMSMRSETLRLLTSQRENDIDHFVNVIANDVMQKMLGVYISQLKMTSKG